MEPPVPAVDEPEHDVARKPVPTLRHHALVPAYVRATGGVRAVFAARGSRTMPLDWAESGGFRVRFPRTEDGAGRGTCEAVLINTGGGLAGGDRMRTEIVVGAGAAATVTTQSAEKIYRSQGPATEIDVSLTVAPGGSLAWLPQEAIMFSGSRWRRRVSADIASDASLTLAEAVVFGRVATGETVEHGSCRDVWRIRRNGRLVLAEDVRLDDSPAALLADKASGDGARALATILHVSPEAEDRLEDARGLIADAQSESGASAWNGMLVVRFLSREPHRVRSDLVRFLEGFRGATMPRSW